METKKFGDYSKKFKFLEKLCASLKIKTGDISSIDIALIHRNLMEVTPREWRNSNWDELEPRGVDGHLLFYFIEKGSWEKPLALEKNVQIGEQLKHRTLHFARNVDYLVEFFNPGSLELSPRAVEEITIYKTKGLFRAMTDYSWSQTKKV